MLRQNDTKARFAYKKITEKGAYKIFPGVTFIAKVKESAMSDIAHLYNEINNHPELSQCFSLLPLSSMHITFNPLFTANEEAGNREKVWKDFIKQNQALFTKIVQDSKQFPESFQVTLTQCVLTHGAIVCSVTLPEQLVALNTQMAEELQLRNKLRPFHMTLAYQFQSLSKEKKTELMTLIDTINAQLNKNPLVFECNQPHLCHFMDMTAFHDWDGQQYPFTSWDMSAEPVSNPGNSL